ncbi:ParA family protein [Pseudomonas soli]|uniref:ParA family protein n=1 Tax=Pseudomonas soli TaxID=1306993 RepID=A0ABU7GWD6_9PSED|nr:ParA family protein [Pseudomonas soli]MEE1883372.1 ParA family protein [Pseudomonas soli]
MQASYSIGCLSQKGGVLKSTLSEALTVAFTLNGWLVKLIDLDPKQATSSDWHKRRLAAGHEPVMPCQLFGSLAAALRQAGEADLYVFDGAPHATTDTAEIAKLCDMVVLPTGLTIDDLSPAVTLANTLTDKHGIPAEKIVFALTKAGSSKAEVADAREYLRKTRFHTLDGAIQLKPAFSRALDAGLSLIETPFKGPRAQATEVINAAITKFTELTAAS